MSTRCKLFSSLCLLRVNSLFGSPRFALKICYANKNVILALSILDHCVWKLEIFLICISIYIYLFKIHVCLMIFSQCSSEGFKKSWMHRFFCRNISWAYRTKFAIHQKLIFKYTEFYLTIKQLKYVDFDIIPRIDP